jgi:glycosyltransferase involved in cell wall biosynthesis
MFHGFNVENVKSKEPRIVSWLNAYASLILVLSEGFKEWLVQHSVTVPVEIVTTKIDDSLLQKFNISARAGKINSVLYLARATKEKGLFIAIEVFKLLASKYPSLKFNVVGAGADLEAAKEMSRDISDRITFTGELKGEKLVREFTDNDLYLFTSFHEGMPASVLEAMAFGLPIVSRPVGALSDFFESGKMGYLVNSFDAEDFILPIENLMSHPEEVFAMSRYNFEYAKQHFYASKVARKFESVIKEHLS